MSLSTKNSNSKNFSVCYALYFELHKLRLKRLKFFNVHPRDVPAIVRLKIAEGARMTQLNYLPVAALLFRLAYSQQLEKPIDRPRTCIDGGDHVGEGHCAKR